MNRRDKAEYAMRLSVRLALGAAIGGHAYARRRVRAVRDRLT